MGGTEDRIWGRNAVIEAYRAGRTVDKLFVQEHLSDGPVRTILREAKKQNTIVNFVTKDRLDEIAPGGHHQGVVAQVSAYEYSSVEAILTKAEERGEPPFIILLDGIEDPHNFGAVIRTACQAGAHGVITTKHRAAPLSSTVARTSAGALNYIPVAKVTNLVRTIEELKGRGIWFAASDMDGSVMYETDLKGPVALVIGSEGEGVSRLVREACDFSVSIPMRGEIDSLNASVAAGILMYEVVRQRRTASHY